MENSKILIKNRQIDFSIIVALALIAAALCWINYSDIDVKIQNHFFDFETKTWLVDRNEPIKKFIFYKFPKMLLGAGIVFCLGAAIVGFKNKSKFFFQNRQKFLLIFLGLALIPLITGNIKKFTNVYCPCQLSIYEGSFVYTKIFEKNHNISLSDKPDSFKKEPVKRGKCFPGGHSVTGFALLILFFAFERKRLRIFTLFSGLTLGWILGLYQMAKGVHFFGDTLVSMLVCFLIAAIIARIHGKIGLQKDLINLVF